MFRKYNNNTSGPFKAKNNATLPLPCLCAHCAPSEEELALDHDKSGLLCSGMIIDDDFNKFCYTLTRAYTVEC